MLNENIYNNDKHAITERDILDFKHFVSFFATIFTFSTTQYDRSASSCVTQSFPVSPIICFTVLMDILHITSDHRGC